MQWISGWNLHSELLTQSSTNHFLQKFCEASDIRDGLPTTYNKICGFTQQWNLRKITNDGKRMKATHIASRGNLDILGV